MAKKQKKQVKVISRGPQERNQSTIFPDGSRSVRQLLAASAIKNTSENEMLIEENYMKSFTVNFPSSAYVGFMDKFYSYAGDMDVAVHVEPTDERLAIEELTKKITQYETQLYADQEHHSVKNSTSIPHKLQNLYEQRSKLEQNNENMYRITTAFTMYDTDSKKLGKESQKFRAKLAGSRFHAMPLTLREDVGYKTVSPFGVNKIPDFYRNMNTGALSCFFPFYNPEIVDPEGIFLGLNAARGTAAFPNLYDPSLPNRNIFISGESGSGKTVFTSIFALRSSALGIRTVIIDPENEYGPVTDSLHGTSIQIAPDSESMINPFDVDEENKLDRNGRVTDEKFVDIKSKASDVLSLLCIMVPACAESNVKSELSSVLLDLYADFGFTADPESLYEVYSDFNEETGEYYSGRRLRVMPRLSDFRNKLNERAMELEDNEELLKIVKALEMYCKGGIYDLFDCYTTVDNDIFTSVPVIRFDISGIENNVLRPIGLYTVTKWIWDKFIKKNVKMKKLLISDESWMMLSKNMEGSEYTAHFLENCARRIRKYGGSLCCASQNFREFVGRAEGLAVLSNSSIKIFLKQSQEDINAVGDKFILSKGERDFLLTANKGFALMKFGKESIILQTIVFPFEWKYIKKDPDEAIKGAGGRRTGDV